MVDQSSPSSVSFGKAYKGRRSEAEQNTCGHCESQSPLPVLHAFYSECAASVSHRWTPNNREPSTGAQTSWLRNYKDFVIRTHSFCQVERKKEKKESEVAQSCPTLCDPMDCRLPGSSGPWNFPGKDTGVGCHCLLQGIFLIQGLNPSLPRYRQMLYHLSHQWFFVRLKYLLMAHRQRQLYFGLTIFFNVGHFLKVFIAFVTTLFLFYVLVLLAMRHVGS